MRRSYYCLMLLLLIAACAGLQAAPFTGVLTDQEQNPVAGVKIYSFLLIAGQGQSCTPKMEASTVTDAEGKYSLGELPDLTTEQCRAIVAYLPGKYIGWLSQSPATASVDQFILVSSLLTVMPTVSKVGHVVDQKGHSLANIPIKYIGLVVQNDFPIPTYLPGEIIKLLGIPTEITTDKNGAYTITDAVAKANILVTPKKKGFDSRDSIVNQSSLKIVLVSAGKIAGQVMDADGKPLKGVNVMAGRMSAYPNSATTNANGRFLLEDLAPGTYHINVHSPERMFVGVNEVKVKAAKTTQAPTIKALRMAGITGKIIYADSGKPAEGIKFIISPIIEYHPGDSYSTTGEVWVTTDKDGSFKAHASVGRNSLIILNAPAGYVEERNIEEITVPKTGLSDVTIKIKKASTGKGLVLDETGKPVENALVSFENYGTVPAETAEDGSFTITLPSSDNSGFSPYGENSYTLNVKQAKRSLGVITQVSKYDIQQNEAVVTVKPLISVKVHVVLPSGKPAAGAKLHLSTEFNHVTTYSPYSGDSPDNKLTDAKGEATINDLLPGAGYGVVASLPGYFDAGKRPRVTAGTTGTNIIEIKLQPAARVQKGKVIDERGKPIAGVEVSAEGPGMETIASTKTDANGNFTLRGLPDCNIQLSASKADRYGSMLVNKSSGTILFQIVQRFYEEN